MKINIVFVFLVLMLNAKGQQVSNRIDEIKEMYQKINSEKENYSSQKKDITWESFENNKDDDKSLEKTINYYYNGSQIMMIVINTSIIGDYSYYKQKLECYYANDSIFFIYLTEKSEERTSLDPESSSETVTAVEKRIYLDKSEKCIRYLKKETEGTPDVIDELCKKSQNVEQNCSDITELMQDIITLLKEVQTIKK